MAAEAERSADGNGHDEEARGELAQLFQSPKVSATLTQLRQMGAALSLPGTVVCCAQRWCAAFLVGGHRAEIDPSLLGVTALYLAAKTRESPRQLRDVVNVGFRLMHPRRPPLAVGKLYEALRESVVQCELILLRHLHFDTTFNAPHKHLLHFVNAIEQSALLWVDDGGPPGTPEATPAAMPRAAAPAQCRQLAAAGIATLNDIYTLEPEVALELAADELAALALLVGCKTQGFHLLPFHSDAFGVWRLFWPGATRPRLESLATRVLESLANAAEAAAAAAAAAGEETAAAAEAGLATGDR